jgi:alkanesulfonate monooxygenase SsuD/methylene tetrahydromethanopterin reductase-like flavin-dependent oxidoreductase (luciferase family)
MRLGFALPHQKPDGSALTAADVAARSQLIERIGFDGIWFGDSISRGSRPRPDPLMTLAVAATATQHVELGTAILQVPLRYPVELAQRLLTLHGLSGGRFSAGLGAGSTRDDFLAVGADYDARFTTLSDALLTMKQLFNGEHVGTATLSPWPNTLGGPPILIGAWHSGPWLRRAAHDFDGWIASGLTSFKLIAEGIKRYREAGGKRALLGTISVNLRAPSNRLSDDEQFHLRCGLEEARDRMGRILELGYDDALLTSLNHTEEDITEEDLVNLRSLVPQSVKRVPTQSGT